MFVLAVRRGVGGLGRAEPGPCPGPVQGGENSQFFKRV